MTRVDTTFKIAPMKSTDLKAVMALEKAIFADAWPREAFLEHLEESGSGGLVVAIGSDIIGYACYQIAEDGVHLTNLAVAPEYRRKSVANGMLDHILGLARKQACDLIYLEVRLSNETALKFYRSAGFIEVDRVTDYYENPREDAVVMLVRVDDEG